MLHKVRSNQSIRDETFEVVLDGSILLVMQKVSPESLMTTHVSGRRDSYGSCIVTVERLKGHFTSSDLVHTRTQLILKINVSILPYGITRSLTLQHSPEEVVGVGSRTWSLVYWRVNGSLSGLQSGHSCVLRDSHVSYYSKVFINDSSVTQDFPTTSLKSHPFIGTFVRQWYTTHDIVCIRVVEG